jgi:hypothetical protein
MSTYVIAEVVGRDKERYAAPSPRNMKSPSQRVEVPARAKFAGAVRVVAQRGGGGGISEASSKRLPATRPVKRVNSSKADADDPTLVEPIELATA